MNLHGQSQQSGSYSLYQSQSTTSQISANDDLFGKLVRLRNHLRIEEHFFQNQVTALVEYGGQTLNSQGSYSRSSQSSQSQSQRSLCRHQIYQKVLDLLRDLTVCQENGDQLEVCSREHWENVEYVPHIGILMKADAPRSIRVQTNRQRQISTLVSIIAELLNENRTTSQRNIYYQKREVFKRQSDVAKAFDDICCILGCQRPLLNITTSSKGLIFGKAWLKRADGHVMFTRDSRNGCQLPDQVSQIVDIESDALFILVVEKDTIFQQIISCDSLKHYPMLTITAKGYPDVNTREMVRKLWDILKIPVFGLFDANPHGIDILCCYKFGSLTMAYANEYYTCPQMRWLGLRPSDLYKLGLPQSSLKPLSPLDESKLGDLQERPYFVDNAQWLGELYIQAEIKHKADIEILSEIGKNYLTKSYLLNKIARGDWI